MGLRGPDLAALTATPWLMNMSVTTAPRLLKGNSANGGLGDSRIIGRMGHQQFDVSPPVDAFASLPHALRTSCLVDLLSSRCDVVSGQLFFEHHRLLALRRLCFAVSPRSPLSRNLGPLVYPLGPHRET